MSAKNERGRESSVGVMKFEGMLHPLAWAAVVMFSYVPDPAKLSRAPWNCGCDEVARTIAIVAIPSVPMTNIILFTHEMVLGPDIATRPIRTITEVPTARAQNGEESE